MNCSSLTGCGVQVLEDELWLWALCGPHAAISSGHRCISALETHVPDGVFPIVSSNSWSLHGTLCLRTLIALCHLIFQRILLCMFSITLLVFSFMYYHVLELWNGLPEDVLKKQVLR